MKRSWAHSDEWMSKFFDLSTIFWALVWALLIDFGRRFIRVPMPTFFVRPTVNPSAVLSSTDDHQSRESLTFKIRVRGWKSKNGYPVFRIYVPPEFAPLGWIEDNAESIGCSMPGQIRMFMPDMSDPVAPGWWRFDFIPSITETKDCWLAFSLRDVIIPKIAGAYWIRAFVYPDGFDQSQRAVKLDTPGLLVKGEVDPGIMTGTVRYGTFNQGTLYQRPINSPGKVWAVGTAIDPYKPGHPSTGRNVTAMGPFNASAKGHYQVEGVAPGVYDMYAEATGYRAELVASEVTMLPGQSFNLDIYLNFPAT